MTRFTLEQARWPGPRWAAVRIGILVATAAAAAAPSLAHAQEVKIGGTGAALGVMRALADAHTQRQRDTRFVVLPSIGTSGGIKALNAGAIQIAVTSRPLKDAEASGGAVATEYGRTPFIFATPTSNKATGITTQELVDIYAGKLEQWPDGSKIRLVLRPVGDSDSEVIKSISPAMREAKNAAEQRKGMLFTVTDQDSADSVEKTLGAIGPSTLALVVSEKRALKALALDGVAPDTKAIAEGRYPLFKTMYMVVAANPPPAVSDFVSFVRSPAGRDILVRNGHWVK
jgi:phosphate transport system substrate-binding protein